MDGRAQKLLSSTTDAFEKTRGEKPQATRFAIPLSRLKHPARPPRVKMPCLAALIAGVPLVAAALPSPTDVYNAAEEADSYWQAHNDPGNCGWTRGTLFAGKTAHYNMTRDKNASGLAAVGARSTSTRRSRGSPALLAQTTSAAGRLATTGCAVARVATPSTRTTSPAGCPTPPSTNSLRRITSWLFSSRSSRRSRSRRSTRGGGSTRSCESCGASAGCASFWRRR